MSASQARPDQFWATAPGKVILSGEHAVVYGQAALAAAINLTSTAHLSFQASASPSPSISLHVPATGWQCNASIDELMHLAAEVERRHQDFLAGVLPLADIFASPEQLLPAAIGYCLREQHLVLSGDAHIELTTALLLGGGMGSSASLVAALMAVLMTACACQFSQQQLLRLVLATEQWQHGRSSGLDPHVCVYGGVQLFQAAAYQQLHLAPLNALYLVSTGRPQSSTGECVEAVRKLQRSADDWQQFGEVTKALQQALEQANISAVISQIKHNHRLLQGINVVPKAVADFIAEVESLGAAGKVCGAGSIAGDKGGLVLLAGLDQQQVARLCDAHGYQSWPLAWQPEGVTYGSQ